MQVNREENGDEIAVEKITSKEKRRLNKHVHEPPGDDEKKVDTGLCCYGYGSEGNGDETVIGSTKSKHKRRSKNHEPLGATEKKVDAESFGCSSEGNGDEIATEKIESERKRMSKKSEPHQGDNEQKIGPDLSSCGCAIGSVGDKLLSDGKIKSKQKKKKIVGDEQQENCDDDFEISKFILKRREPQRENREKIDPELCCYDRDIGFVEDMLPVDRKLKSKDKKKKKVVDHKLQEDDFAVGFVEDKLLVDGKIKSKEKRKKKLVDNKLQKNGGDTKTSNIVLKNHEPEGDNRQKIDPDSCFHGIDIGFVEDNLLVDGKIKSKEKSKKKKTVKDKLRENGDDAEISKFILKKREHQDGNKEKIDPESWYYGCHIGFVEDNLLADGEVKSTEKKKKAVKDELRKNGDDAETSKFILEKCEPRCDYRETIYPELCCYGCDVGFVEDKLLVDANIKSKDKKKKKVVDHKLQEDDFAIGFVEDKLLVDGKIKSKVKKKQAGEEELRENGDDAETSKFILKKRKPQCDNREKIDPELCCDGCDIGFVEDKVVVDGNMKSEDKKKKKVVHHKLQEDDFAVGFVEAKLLVDGKTKSKEKRKRKLVDNKLQNNGDDTETSNFILKRHEPDNREKIDPDSCFYGLDIGFVEDNLLVDGKSKSKEKNKKKKAVKNKPRENGDDAETSKSVDVKFKPQGGNKEKIDPESWSYCCDIGFVEDNLLIDRKIKFKEKMKKKAGYDAETSQYVLKKRERQCDNREKNDPKLCGYGCDIEFVEDELQVDGKVNSVEEELGGVQYVSSYFHDDSAEKINAESLDKESKSNLIALPTSGELLGGKLEEDGCAVKIDQLGHEGYVDSVFLCAASGDFFEDQLKETGNEFKSFDIKSEKKNSNNQKTVLGSDNARMVSLYFQNENVKKTVELEAPNNDENSTVASMGTCGCMVQDREEGNEDKIAIGKNKSKCKGRYQKLEFVDHDPIQKKSAFIQSDNEKKVDADSCWCEIESIASSGIGRSFFGDKTLADGNEMENGTTKFKKIKDFRNKLQENGADDETRNVKSMETESMIQKNTTLCVEYVSPFSHSDSVEKITGNLLNMKSRSDSIALPICGHSIENKLEGKHGGERIKQHVLDSCIDPLAFPVASGDFGEWHENGNEIETLKVESKKKRKSSNQKTAEEHGKALKVSPYFQNDSGKKFSVQPSNKKIKSESMVLPTFGNFMEDKLMENNGGKNVEQQVHADSVALIASCGDFSDDEPQKIGKEIETIKIESMKRKSNTTKTGEGHAKVRKVSPYFQNDNEKAVNVKVHGLESDIDSVALMGTCTSGDKIPIEMFKYEGKGTSKTKGATELAQIQKVSPFFQSNNVKKVGAESCCTGGMLLEHKLIGDGNVIENGLIDIEKKTISNKLQGNGNDTTSKVKPKKTKPLVQKNVDHGVRYVSPYFHNDSGKKMNVKSKPLVQKNVAHSIRYVSPYFHNDSGKNINVEPLDEGSKFESIALNAAENFVEDKPEEIKSSCSEKSIKIKRNLSASEKWDEAYKRKTPDNSWKPPRSAIVLIQEDHAHDPWRVLVICMLLNRTSGGQVSIIRVIIPQHL